VAFALFLELGLVAARASAQLPALRAPQVQVNGSALQQYLNGVGENIDVQMDQRDVELLRSPVSGPSSFTLWFEFAGPPGNTIGFYNGLVVPGALMLMFPTAATDGWFAIASWRVAPVRVVVNLFDASAMFLGSMTYLGANRNAIGIYLATPHATYFTQDPLNPGGEPHALFYEGTGLNAGAMWLAWESGDTPADRDFADCVLFAQSYSPGGIVPVQRATWGELKSRFR